MKWLKKWSYLLLVVGMGILYLTQVDKWQVYAEPLKEAKNWIENQVQQGGLLANGTAIEGAEEGNASDVSGWQNTELPPESQGDKSTVEGTDENQTTETGEAVETPGTGSGNSIASPEGTQPGGTDASAPSGENQPVIPGGEGEPEQGEAQNPSEDPKEVTYMTVEDDYFSDAVFIGDSRTMGLFEYGGLEETASFYASTGLTVYEMFNAKIVPGEQGKISVEEALQQNSFSKIYFMIGINEMGTGTVESFLEAYQEAVTHLQELQPDAIIYLQAIIKVTTERSDKGDYINNEGIMARNEGIAQMADNEHIFYLDVNPLICDESGGMIPEYTFDGVHLKAMYIDIWKDFLKTHAIALE